MTIIKKNGFWKEVSTDRHRRQGFYKNGQKQGLWKCWYSLSTESGFWFECVYVNGDLNGLFNAWTVDSKDGEYYMRRNYVNHEMEGEVHGSW